MKGGFAFSPEPSARAGADFDRPRVATDTDASVESAGVDWLAASEEDASLSTI